MAGAAKQTLVWDVEGELVSVAQDGNGDGDTADAAETDTYVYSADGDRLLRVQDGKTTAYLPGGTEATLSGATVTALRYYIFGGHTVAVRTANAASGTTTLLADPHGTRTAQVNQNGNVIIRNYTDPFGGRRNATVLTGDHGFLDKPVDTTGLTQVGARYYDPALGRFVTVDPLLDLSDPQQWNPYAYANSNPVTWSDPTGLILDDDGNPRNAPHPAAIARAKAGPTVSSRTSIAPRRQWSEAAIKADNQMHPANKLMPRWMPTQGKVAAAVIEPADFVANTIDATRRPTFSMYWGSIQQWIDGANAAVLNTALTFSPFFELRGATVAARATAGSAAAARTATNTADDALAAATRAAPSSVSVGPGASLENITVSQATRIQNAANRIGQPISLVGSRASGTSGAYSDWDYVITGINSRVKHSVSGSLPRGATELGYGRQIDIFTGPLGDHLPHITFNPVG